MTYVTQRSAAVRSGVRRPVLVAAAIFLMAFALRAFGLGTANELFIDELTYARLAVAVSSGELPNLSGAPFFLHPPGSFALNGVLVNLLSLDGTTMEIVYQLRWVNALLGALVVLLAHQLARRVTTPGIALVVAVVLAFDPFVLRNDSRVMLETPATAALLAGWLVLISFRRPAIAGLLFGCAVLTKDITLVLVAVPLLLAITWRRTMPHRIALRAFAATLVPYTVYLVVLLFTGHLGEFLSSKTLGLCRMAGLVQITGFNAPGAPSLTGRLADQVTHFGTSYVLITLCLFAGAGTALCAGPARRLIGLFAFACGAFGVYAATTGTLEEQFGYYLLVPSVLALAALAAENRERSVVGRRAVVVVVGVFTALTVLLGVTSRFQTDDSYRRVSAWLDGNIAPGTSVGLTNVTMEFAFLPRHGYGVWPSLLSLKDHRAQYVVTQSRTLAQGYGYATPGLLDWLKAHARSVHVEEGPTGGQTVVWQLDGLAVRRAVDDGLSQAPVTGPHR